MLRAIKNNVACIVLVTSCCLFSGEKDKEVHQKEQSHLHKIAKEEISLVVKAAEPSFSSRRSCSNDRHSHSSQRALECPANTRDNSPARPAPLEGDTEQRGTHKFEDIRPGTPDLEITPENASGYNASAIALINMAQQQFKNPENTAFALGLLTTKKTGQPKKRHQKKVNARAAEFVPAVVPLAVATAPIDSLGIEEEKKTLQPCYEILPYTEAFVHFAREQHEQEKNNRKRDIEFLNQKHTKKIEKIARRNRCAMITAAICSVTGSFSAIAGAVSVYKTWDN